MAKQRKPKPDRNRDLSPDQIYRKRALRQTIAFWFVAFLIMLASTVASIQAGPFGLNLAVGTSANGVDEAVSEFSWLVLGGFGVAWMLLAIVPAVLYYRWVIDTFLPSKRAVPKDSQVLADQPAATALR